MTPLYRFLLYFFPFPLGMLEWLIRTSMHNADATEFLGPALCTAALAMLLPIIVPKSVHASQLNLPAGVIFPTGYKARKAGDETIVGIGVIALITGIAIWGTCLYLSIGGILLPPLKDWTEGHDTKLWIGAILYIVAVILTEAKERT